MKIGDKYRCVETIENSFGNTLFKKDNIYTILDLELKLNIILLDHTLLSNEYTYLDIEILRYFISIKKDRRLKINKLIK